MNDLNLEGGEAFVVAAPDGCECWRDKVNEFAKHWLHLPASELVFTRDRSVAVRCAIRRSVRRGGRRLKVVHLTCTHEGEAAVGGCFPLCPRMLENIAALELGLVKRRLAATPESQTRHGHSKEIT